MEDNTKMDLSIQGLEVKWIWLRIMSSGDLCTGGTEPSYYTSRVLVILWNQVSETDLY